MRRCGVPEVVADNVNYGRTARRRSDCDREERKHVDAVHGAVLAVNVAKLVAPAGVAPSRCTNIDDRFPSRRRRAQ